MDYNTNSIKTGSKNCCTCKILKPLTKEYFGIDSKHKTGFKKRCKECRKKEYEEKREMNMARSKKRYDEKKDEILIKNKAYKEKRSDWYQEYNSNYYLENRERMRGAAKKYFEENKVKMLAANKRYRMNNKGYDKYSKRKYSQNRRSKMAGLESTLTNEQWTFICKSFDESCAYCGKAKKLAQDHFIPLNQGGEYTHNNIVPSCANCNSSKSKKNFFEWYPTSKFYSEKRKRKILSFLNYKDNMQQLSIL